MNHRALIKTLTFIMFLMFAMTTDSVGVIIPKSSRDSAVDDGGGRVPLRHHGGHCVGGHFPGLLGR
jgi:hypothetical protein